MELIDRNIEINEDFLPDSDLAYNIYFDKATNTFEARLNNDYNKGVVVLEDAPKILKYRLDKPLEKFTTNEKEMILDYRGLNLKNDGFGLSDVFMEKSFITLLTFH